MAVCGLFYSLPECKMPASGWCLLTAVRLSKSASCSRPAMGEEEGSFVGSGLSPWGSEVGFPCSSTNVSAMHAIPVGKTPRQPPSAQHWVHPYTAYSLPPHTGDHRVTTWVAQCHVAGRAHRRGRSQGSRG